MRKLSINELEPVDSLPQGIFHFSGEQLLEQGEFLSERDIKAMDRLGIKEVIFLDPIDDRAKFLIECHYRELSIEALPDGRTLQKPLTDHKGHVILEANTMISREVKDSLKKRGMHNVYVKRSDQERRPEAAEQFKIFHSKIAEEKINRNIEEGLGKIDLNESNIIIDPRREISVRGVENKIMSGGADVKPFGDSLRSKIVKRARKTPRTAEVKDEIIDVQDNALGDVRKLFKHFQEREMIDGALVGDLSKNIIAALMKDKDLLLNTLNKQSDSEYFQRHAVCATIIATNIATALQYSSQQVLEVAYGALLHNVGMYRIPEKILSKPGRLTQSEFLEIQKHPSYNLEYLQRVKRIPMSAPIVGYQVHERIDRSGYPKQKPGNLIHSFAKIIMIADVYTALTSDRPYRKALSPFRAARTIVELGAQRQLDADVIRHFLQFVCLFPVGSWVRLNNGHVGKVISANEDDYTRPVVNLMYDRNLDAVKHYIVDLREEPKLGVVDGLTSENFLEHGIMEGF